VKRGRKVDEKEVKKIELKKKIKSESKKKRNE